MRGDVRAIQGGGRNSGCVDEMTELFCNLKIGFSVIE